MRESSGEIRFCKSLAALDDGSISVYSQAFLKIVLKISKSGLKSNLKLVYWYMFDKLVLKIDILYRHQKYPI